MKFGLGCASYMCLELLNLDLNIWNCTVIVMIYGLTVLVIIHSFIDLKPEHLPYRSLSYITSILINYINPKIRLEKNIPQKPK